MKYKLLFIRLFHDNRQHRYEHKIVVLYNSSKCYYCCAQKLSKIDVTFLLNQFVFKAVYQCTLQIQSNL